MRNITTIILLTICLYILPQSTTTYRDNLGRKDGTAKSKGNGTTYRDNVGRKQRSSTKR